MAVRAKYGSNKIVIPGECPAWLCCLLSLKRNNPRTQLSLEDCIPEHAKVLRNGKFILMDSRSIVIGDIVKISKGDSVPADLRIFEVT
jgi:magnesium-transporting ATPase (P-type)